MVVRFDGKVIYDSTWLLFQVLRNDLSVIFYPSVKRRFPVDVYRMDYDNKIGKFDFSYRLRIDGLEPIPVSSSLELTAEVEQCSSLPPFESWSIWDLE